MTALDELRAGQVGDHFLALLQRTIRAVAISVSMSVKPALAQRAPRRDMPIRLIPRAFAAATLICGAVTEPPFICMMVNRDVRYISLFILAFGNQPRNQCRTKRRRGAH